MAEENFALTNTASDAGPALAPELESKVAAGLASVFQGQDDVIEEPAEKDQVEPQTEEVADTVEGTDATEAATEEDAVSNTADTPTVSTLPAAYVRSLKALEWTDEEIADAAKRPELLPSIVKLHNSRNKTTNEWAEAGRRARQQQQTPNTDASQQQQMGTGLTPIDPKKLKAQYGDDKLIDELVGPVNKAIEQINSMLPLVQQTQQRSQQAELEMLGKQIDGFFSDKELVPFAKFYGEGGKQTTPEQFATRQKVLETADALIGGARQQGRNLSVGEALRFAHDSVSSGFKTEAVRSGIKKQLQTRSRGITLKPSARGATAGNAKVSSRSALERKVNAGMKSVFT